MQYIIDFRTLLEHAPPSSVYWSLADAFDAVTNGMENPEAESRLDSDKTIELAPWKALVAAIKALYNMDPAACAAALKNLDEESPQGTLAPLFRAWIAAAAGSGERAVGAILGEASAPIRELYGRLAMETHPLAVLAEQAEEALRQGLEGHREALEYRILRELQDQRLNDGPLLAVRYALYRLKRLEADGRCLEDFFTLLLRALGKADGFLTIGLFLLNRDRAAASEAIKAAARASDGEFLQGPLKKLLVPLSDVLEGAGKPRGRKPAAEPKLQLELF